jgi:hypothetical protein
MFQNVKQGLELYHLEDLGTYERKTVNSIFKEKGCAMARLAQNRNQWQALVNTVINLQVP